MDEQGFEQTQGMLQEPAEELGLAGRMVRVFTSPGATFEAVRQRAGWTDWLIPTLVLIVVSLAATQVTKPMLLRLQQTAMAEQFKNMPPEQREAAMKAASAFGDIAMTVGPPVVSLVMLFAAAGVLALIARWGLGGPVTYAQALAVWSYSSLVHVLAWLVRAPLMLAKDTGMVYLGPAVLLPDAALNTFAGRLLAGLDLFVVWQVAIAAVGLGVLTRRPALRAFAILVLVWLLWTAAMAGVAGMHPTPPPRS